MTMLYNLKLWSAKSVISNFTNACIDVTKPTNGYGCMYACMPVANTYT